MEVLFDEEVEADSVNALHFGDNGSVDILRDTETAVPASMESLASDEETLYILENGSLSDETAETAGGVAFDTASFSVYGVVYSVEVTLVDLADAAVPGRSFILLSEMAQDAGTFGTEFQTAYEDGLIIDAASSDGGLVRITPL